MATLENQTHGLARFAAATTRVEKPWGYEHIYAVTPDYCGKLLFVRAGESLSMQLHRRKDETIYVHSGRARFEIGESADQLEAAVVGPEDSFRIRPGVVHRVLALEDTLLLEVSTPHLDDVVRLEDRYGRAGDGA
jgi:mannose-6-phosphate isomerase-like protein (cupin superfamily)